ncbi:hypothetical protein AVEN_219380-1 [Araneus ventricosus]|uniref:Uncharacterized protein n=1 Tax=Araneus ventricosus TaxID=182803 RepID=A0A4Y2BH47_ARAVE|nr:hypothetical protein AVEN_219380-1 [Araneus ventricosus]
MRPELKGIGFKRCSTSRKFLVIVTNRKGECNLQRNIEIGPLNNGNKSYGPMSLYLLCSNMMAASGLEEKHLKHCTPRVPYPLHKPLEEVLDLDQ